MSKKIIQEIPEKEACGKKYKIEIIFNSITTEFKLYCEKGNIKETYEFFVLVVGSIMVFVFSIVQDILGRKKILTWSYLVMIIFWVCAYFQNSLSLQLFGLACFWGYQALTCTVIYLYLNELTVNPFRNYAVNCCSIFMCAGGLFGNLCTAFISDYKLLNLIIFSSYFLSFLLCFFLLPESPNYLLKNSKIEELKEAVCGIGSTNGLSNDQVSKALDDLEIAIQSNYILTFLNKKDEKNNVKVKKNYRSKYHMPSTFQKGNH